MEANKAKAPNRAAVAEKNESKTPLSLPISERYKAQLRQAFDLFDTDGTGRINPQDVKVALSALGYDVNKEELNQLLRHVGASSSGVMDFNDFYSVLVAKMMQRESRSEAIRAFKLMDVGDKGFIGVDDLRPIAASLEMNLTDDELAEMVLFAHPSVAMGKNDSEPKEHLTVSEEEFLKLMGRAHVF
ncbi:EF hand domain [Trypanosoma vivax]|uniref:Putative centrin n=1 Tax=Trypanosoma vivax (strain Y486) TaxID=1055687 RepID=G0U8R1_TRYVY|nr:putative centrin [Trypanosoma vivax]KAH8603553.1 EF hand domain [Trypanosoma vivax]KAH8613379.1 EF hand domain [Trypanosoma vivax]CCC53989.1 putative centrin [Trypanosoma vivax Y486]